MVGGADQQQKLPCNWPEYDPHVAVVSVVEITGVVSIGVTR
jgi:hypothetical protein